MSKCGCAGQGGSVVFEDTPSVEISGAGTAQNPYRINVQQLHVTTQDTATIDLTLTGTGSETNPYTIKADFIGVIQPPDFHPSETAFWTGVVNLSAVTGPKTIRATLNGNVTSVVLPTWSSSASGAIYLVLSQDATGGRTWVMPGTSANGVDVVLSTAPGARDFIRLFWTGLQWIVMADAKAVS
jgi:hypothetical protein